jgi:hypothetical protein
MRITYPRQSSFEHPIRAAIRAGRERLSRGLPVTVTLRPRGYKGRVVVTIDPGDRRSFQSDWEQPDPSRFPARIKAAAKALLTDGEYGTFTISHADGILQIQRGDILAASTH